MKLPLLGIGTASGARRSALGLFLLTPFGCAGGGDLAPARVGIEGAIDAPLEAVVDNALPPPAPALPIDIDPRVGGQDTHTHFSPTRATFDGRIVVTAQCNPQDGSKSLSFWTFRPEGYTQPVSAVNQAVPLGAPLTVAAYRSDDGGKKLKIVHAAVCDPGPPARRSPTACAGDSQEKDHDCYDFAVIATVQAYTGETCDEDLDKRRQLWSFPVHVRVAHPKTTAAKVDQVTVDAPVRSKVDIVSLVDEPVVSGDGHLVVFHDSTAGGLQYLVHRGTQLACDVTRWKPAAGGAPYPIAGLFKDPAAAGYGLARYPFRDTLNNVLGPTATILGSYPWMDRRANNLFFMQVGAGPFYVDAADPQKRVRARYPLAGGAQPPDVATVKATTDAQGREGLSWMGLWSHGKMVTLDGRLNNADFGVKPAGSYRFALYRDQPAGTLVDWSRNLTIASLENQHNWLDPMLPDSPRDVAWHLTNDFATDEVAFDDQLDNRALVVSSMTAAVDNKNKGFYDGNLRTFDFNFVGSKLVSTARYLQNEATSVSGAVKDTLVAAGLGARIPAGHVQWNVPAKGVVLGGARIEPIAAGGRRGKGIYLDGVKNRVEYAVPPTQPHVMDGDWTYMVWVDARPGAATPARILTTPDGTHLSVLNPSTLRYQIGTNLATKVDVPLDRLPPLAAGVWRHLAVVSRADGHVEIYVDGMRLSRLAKPAYFRMVAGGNLVLGAFAQSATTVLPGLPGWFDDLKVLGRAPTFEEICNHAHGTLVGNDVNDPRGGAYPADAHAAISAELTAHGKATFATYFCEIAGSPTHLCIGSTHRHGAVPAHCLHAALSFPEGPLHAAKERPGSLANDFCKSCHADTNPVSSLTLASLAYRTGVHEQDDPRRQPLQPPAILCGFHAKDQFDIPLDPLVYP